MYKVFSTGIPEAEVTVDGLVRVDNAVVPVAYRKPDMDLTPYTRFMLDPVEVAYQKDPGNRMRSGGAGTNDNFALSPSQMETLKGMFREAVVAALTNDDGYELTTEPGPDVLRIAASLVDLVVRRADTAGRPAAQLHPVVRPGYPGPRAARFAKR